MSFNDELLKELTTWQAKCCICVHLLRSGDDGNVWRCALFKAGRNHMYAITARDDKKGRCGIEAKKFKAFPTEDEADAMNERVYAEFG